MIDDNKDNDPVSGDTESGATKNSASDDSASDDNASLERDFEVDSEPKSDAESGLESELDTDERPLHGEILPPGNKTTPPHGSNILLLGVALASIILGAVGGGGIAWVMDGVNTARAEVAPDRDWAKAIETDAADLRAEMTKMEQLLSSMSVPEQGTGNIGEPQRSLELGELNTRVSALEVRVDNLADGDGSGSVASSASDATPNSTSDSVPANTPDTAVTNAEIVIDLDALKSQVEALTAQTQNQTEILSKKVASLGDAVTSENNQGLESAAVTPAQIKALETSLNAKIDDIQSVASEKSEILTALQSRIDDLTDDVNAWVPTINAVDQIRTDLQSLQMATRELQDSRASMDAVGLLSGQVDEITTRIAAVERGPEIKALPPFPKESVIAALTEADVANDPSWLERLIDSQVSVTPDERIRQVEKIETLVLRGDYDTALAALSKLPEPAQEAASLWVNSLQTYRNQNE